ncbi:serine/arginine repetitive matrix protein 1 [Streptomyces vinaceus]|uniref:serine/arginine repetitive matrix protein 1 n=1 Tax=Streptomyces vinaceus TaxID=1960 RepID=UPI0035E1C8A0
MTPTEEGPDTSEAVEAAPSAVPRQRGRSGRRTRRSSSPPQLDFPPVRNGLDYLESVVDHLDEDQSTVTPRDVKYAVLHLQAAVEVLFKARLYAEHWTLVFANPDEATPIKRDSADFKSVTTDAAITRLRNIVGVPITDKERKALKNLSEDRNKLQHFGFTHDARVIEARAAEVLDFLVRFIDDSLVPYLRDDQEKAKVHKTLARIRGGLTAINSYVRERMNRIGGELKSEDVENRTIECPACEQLALVLCASDLAACRFCAHLWDPEELLSYFIGHGQEEPSELNTCPQCEEQTLGWAVRVRSDPTKPIHVCFSCATAFPSVEPCERCMRPIDAKGDTGTILCGSCWSDLEDEQRYGWQYEEPEDYGYDGEWG